MSIRTATHSTRIEIQGLVKRYHYHPVLNHLSMTIDDGSLCVLVGANGAGKTTLLRILAALVRPDKGQIRLGGVAMANDPPLRRKLGYVGHQPMFYQDLSALENLLHYARLYQLAHPSEKVHEGIALVNLTQYQHKPVRAFSRGMQQRLSIARALLHDPDILLFDEPYTGLDQEAALLLDERLRNLHQPGRTILVAAHRPQRLIPIASHIAWLKDGHIAPYIEISRLNENPELQDYLQEAL